MAHLDLQDFLAALERDGDLARVRVPVDPHLEVTGIVARTLREQGPALLFEKPTRGQMPLLLNAFGTNRRMCRALGVDDLDEIGNRIADLLKPELPRGVGGLKDAIGKAAQLRTLPPRRVKSASCQEIVLRGDDIDLEALLPGVFAWPEDGGVFLNLGLTHTKHPETGARNLGHVPPAVAGPTDGQSALADPQGLHQPCRDRRASWRTTAGRDRARLPAGGDLRRVRAAARRHRRVPVRGVRQPRPHRPRRLRERPAAGLLSLSKLIVVVDADCDVHNYAEVAWRAFGNVDYAHDVLHSEGPVDHLDHASYEQFFGGKLGIDATRKLPTEGYRRDGGWPTECVLSTETTALVERRWREYGIETNVMSVDSCV